MKKIVLLALALSSPAYAGQWGIGDSWYEGKHQGGGSGDDVASLGSHLPPPDPPAIIHHKDEITIPTQAEDNALKEPLNDRKADNQQIRSICLTMTLSTTCAYINAHPKQNFESTYEAYEAGTHPF